MLLVDAGCRDAEATSSVSTLLPTFTRTPYYPPTQLRDCLDNLIPNKFALEVWNHIWFGQWGDLLWSCCFLLNLFSCGTREFDIWAIWNSDSDTSVTALKDNLPFAWRNSLTRSWMETDSIHKVRKGRTMTPSRVKSTILMLPGLISTKFDMFINGLIWQT